MPAWPCLPNFDLLDDGADEVSALQYSIFSCQFRQNRGITLRCRSQFILLFFGAVLFIVNTLQLFRRDSWSLCRGGLYTLTQSSTAAV